MKKKILSLLTCLCLIFTALFSITACGENPKGNNPDGESPPPATTWNGIYQRLDSKTVLFGSYPQSYVTDSETIGTLNTQAGTPSTQPNLWTGINYLYRSGNADLTLAKYTDIEYEGEKYRGVYVNKEKPLFTSESVAFEGGLYISEHYALKYVHWFKYEPIKWKIVAGADSDTLVLFADKVIDSMHFFNGKSDHKVEGESQKVYSNNYKYSDIRAWLNDYFYDLAFNSTQQAMVLTTTVDNSTSTLDREDSYRCACDNTEAKVYLPSYKDINSNFGLTTAEERKKEASDYSIIIGARTAQSNNKNIAPYSTRSPFVYSKEPLKSYRHVVVALDGTITGEPDEAQTAYAYNGVCPMITIDISSIS